jgi:hypothetical protein
MTRPSRTTSRPTATSHLQRDFGRVESEWTRSFRSSFIRSSDSLSKVLVQYKATASAKVLAADVSLISSSKAVVLLFANQTVANSTQLVVHDGPDVDAVHGGDLPVGVAG